MKIKILKPSDWYKHFVGSEFEVDYYEEISSTNLRFRVEDNGWVYIDHCVITELPESFCVKRCDDDNRDDWNKYLQWLNKQKNFPMFGGVDRYKYYGINGEKLHSDYLYPFGIEIHIDDMIKHIEYMERHIKGGEQFHKESQLTVKMNTQKLSRQGLKEIHSIACSSWKITLEGWGSRNPLEDYIELSQKEIDMMFNASDNNQKSILSKYLKQDDGSVDLSDLNISLNKIIDIRKSGEYENKSFWISESYNWEIKKDSIGKLCLIPTKKK